ncbi:MAG: hypothetical protein CL398_11015 [Acidiferrobacteraceae bacterium]|nr:hypothetical protein [Acidiferrobacteraceae bacterium]
MKIPKGMTEDQVIETINKVISRYIYKFRFGYYESEDIRQEAFIIAMEALERYDEERPLENFLAVHVKNRLSNFKRDKFFRKEGDSTKTDWNSPNNAKRFLMEPLNIDNIRDEYEENMKDPDDFIDRIANTEIFGLIDKSLDIKYRADYLRMLDGVYVPKPRREQIYQEILSILRSTNEEG